MNLVSKPKLSSSIGEKVYSSLNLQKGPARSKEINLFTVFLMLTMAIILELIFKTSAKRNILIIQLYRTLVRRLLSVE